MERFLITDVNNPGESAISETELPVMFDMVNAYVQDFNHAPGGGNVLYMDGHVEFETYPSKQPYPLSPAWAQLMDYDASDWDELSAEAEQTKPLIESRERSTAKSEDSPWWTDSSSRSCGTEHSYAVR